PVQTAVCPALPVGALAVEVAIQLSVSGLYLAPVFKWGVGVGVGGGGPEAEFGLFRPPAFSEVLPSNPPPHDHFAPSPDGCVKIPGGGRVDCPRRCPAFFRGFVSPSGVKRIAKGGSSPPDDHLSAVPYRCVVGWGNRRVSGASGRPTIRSRVVSPACVDILEGK